MTGNHWSDEQLIEHRYGIGPGDGHLDGCAECRARLQALHNSRARVEADFDVADGVTHELLAAQRRAIYRRLEAGTSGAWRVAGRAWATAALGVALLGGGWIMHEKSRTLTADQPKISDTELVEQVSQIADNPEPQPAAPIEALFED